MNLAKFKTHMISTLVVGFFIFIAIGSTDDNKTETNTENSTINEELTPDKLKEVLEREIATFDKPFDGSSYKKDVTSLQLELALFGLWGNYIVKGSSSEFPEVKKLAEKLKTKVVALQKKEFPKMREAYTKILANKMWEHDMYVSSEGTSKRIINLTAAIFAANKNIKETQNALQEGLTLYRFRETRYRWYKEAEEFTYYKLETPKDEELVTLDK